MRLMIYVFFVVLASVALARVELVEEKPKKAGKERKPAAKPTPTDQATKNVAKKVAADSKGKKEANPEEKKAAKPGAKKAAEPKAKKAAKPEVLDFDNTDSVKSFSNVVENLSSKHSITFQCKHFCQRDLKCVKQCMELSMMMG